MSMAYPNTRMNPPSYPRMHQMQKVGISIPSMEGTQANPPAPKFSQEQLTRCREAKHFAYLRYQENVALVEELLSEVPIPYSQMNDSSKADLQEQLAQAKLANKAFEDQLETKITQIKTKHEEGKTLMKQLQGCNALKDIHAAQEQVNLYKTNLQHHHPPTCHPPALTTL